MKLRNKKTGGIVRVEFLSDWQTDDGTEIGFRVCNTTDVYSYTSLAELNEEWEDYEEPAYYYFIHDDGRIGCDAIDPYNHKSKVEERKSIGNYFETREEAEKAVEKLKTWKRLKDIGFKFNGWSHTPITKSLIGYNLHIKAYTDKLADYMDDLQLLFGGEE